MKKIIKIICIFLAFNFFSVSSNSEIKDSLFATVGNKAITESDIKNEIMTILILTDTAYSPDKKDQLQSVAVKEMVRRNIKKIEVEKYPALIFNKSDLDGELLKLALGLNINVETLRNRFEVNGIDFSIVMENLKTELLWNGLIYELYKDRLTINLEEIDEQLIEFDNQEEINEYLISEIILKSVATPEINSEVEKVKNKIINEGFEKTAMDLSISETALKGGDLGWINENAISEQFKSKIIKTPVGKVSEPIILPEGILLFKVRDKRNLKTNLTVDDAKKQLVNAEKTKLLNMYSLSHYDKLRRSIAINYY
tara:strand:- start:3013 stop:3948 length:936 start_codon:yes stop_codon:yes gene_type:complete